jgi:tetratricopeptide (TPR) repeat protein
MPQVKKVMISSTARDLPDHRKEALDACLRLSMLPIMMEHLPASDEDAISESLRMVNESDIYVGIYAYRYGTIPKGHNISITEMEYNRAKERGIPCLIFLMDKTHPITPEQMGEGLDDEAEEIKRRAKLSALKKRVGEEKVVNTFKSPADLRAHMISSLSPHRESDAAGSLHYVSDIPEPPNVYIAHPYTLLQTSQLVGRRDELNLLTDWVAKPSSPLYHARIFNVVAIGGMGKSAMTWKWFNDIAPQEMNPLAGRMWWSFYESDAHFENFVTRALAYVSRTPREEIQKLPPPEREDKLLKILNDEPFLLVLDGLERILIAYARMDAAHFSDDDYDKQTANWVAGAYGLPASAGESFVGQHRLRKTADVRAGQFLRKLAQVNKSRILVSTRLYPADLQLQIGAPMAGCTAVFLEGLSDDDALEVWRGNKVTDFEGNELSMTGSRDALLPLFRQFENYPLLIRALAGEVANYRRAPGDFDKWRAANPDFTPVLMRLRHEDAKSHVLKYALQNLDTKSKQLLHTIAAFRAPASYDTLAALTVEGVEPLVAEKNKDDFDFDNDEEEKEEQVEDKPPKLFASEPQLDAALTELEDRGLLGWDKRANRYDLHPIVRGVTWANVDKATQQGVYKSLHGYFVAVPNKFGNWQDVESLDDLAPAIELYDKLVRLGRYDDAYIVFRDRLSDATLYRLSASRQRAELLEMLFPDGVDTLPRLLSDAKQAYTLNTLALAYQDSGHTGRSVPLFRLHNKLRENSNDQKNLSGGLRNLSDALRLLGRLREAEYAARRALGNCHERDDRFQEAISLQWLGLDLAVRGLQSLSHHRGGLKAMSDIAMRRSLKILVARNHIQSEGLTIAYLGQAVLWRGDYFAARSLANRAWELSHHLRFERDFIRAAQLKGAAALGLGDFAMAEEWLHHALPRARAVNLVEQELPALVALAELERQRGKPELAREYLDDVWEGAERGPYPLFHADALNVLAQIERDAGNTDAAIKAATQAYEKAWCDGISADGKTCYAYWWGLQKAKAHLDALGAPYPDLPPFDESKFEPMPDVEINPRDEFYVDEDELE